MYCSKCSTSNQTLTGHLHAFDFTSMFLFVDVLIPHLANVNVTDRAGRTSLHHAAFNGHVEVQIICTVHSKGST